MTVFGFNNRRDAENLSYFSKTMNFERGRKIGAPEGHETILVKAPSDGIDAKASGQCSSAQCFVVHITEDGDVVDNTNEVEVWNFTEQDVDADAYISCFRFRESWVFDAASTSGSSLKQLTATSAITAASGLTFGTGTADILQINSGGTAYETAGLADVDIINPWEESIASGAMLTCYKEVAKYVIVQVSCPA
jgi:hypothetical protein